MVTAMVLGIIGCVLSFISIFFAGWLSFIGLVLGILALRSHLRDCLYRRFGRHRLSRAECRLAPILAPFHLSRRLGKGIEEIGNYAFDNLDLSFLCLPSSIKNIAPYAFSGFNPSSVICIDSPSVTIEGGCWE